MSSELANINSKIRTFKKRKAKVTRKLVTLATVANMGSDHSSSSGSGGYSVHNINVYLADVKGDVIAYVKPSGYDCISEKGYDGETVEECLEALGPKFRQKIRLVAEFEEIQASGCDDEYKVTIFKIKGVKKNSKKKRN